MAWSPDQIADATLGLRQTYADAEVELYRRIARRVGTDMDSSAWAEQKLADIQRLRHELDEEVQRLAAQGMVDMEELVERGYTMGANGMVQDLQQLRPDLNITTAFSRADRRRIEAFISEAAGLIEPMHGRILRRSEDIYRSVIADTARLGVVGVDTRRQAAQRALNRFANQGITGFVDSAGRNWDMASYSEMAIRTTMGRAALAGATQRMTEHGYDLVIVSYTGQPCELCDAYEGAILSLSGRDRRYTSMSQAQNDGLYHPNCTHSASAWIEGLTQRPEKVPKQQREARYGATQQQRYQERQIRQWKRREAVALDDQEAQAARRKVREWQGRQRSHVSEWDLRRKPERESISRAR